MAPPPADKQQRRQERRRLLKVGRDAVAHGFSDDLDDEIPVGVLLMLHDKICETGNNARAGEAAELAEQVLERSNARFVRQFDVACKRGCWHCCATVVSVTPPEIFRVAAWLRKNRMNSPTLSPAAIERRCHGREGVAPEDAFRLKVPCPLLIGGECGVHLVRPINCRQLLSTSLPACIESFGGADTPIPYVGGAMDRGALSRALLTAATKSAGLPDTGYELAGALSRALADDRSEARWLAGEDVFAGVLVTPRPASTQAFVDRCVEVVERNR